jgi:ferric-dicitrate binding protein FerR (iron transport regulator)
VLWIQTKKVEQPAQQQITQQEIIKDIEPGGNKATLTLANGSKIILDSAANGNVAIQGNTVVQKKEGSLSYNSEGQVGIKQDPVINVLHTPNGGQYNITLSDGTEVWLNAASSLRFPTAFTDKERVVQLTGEGYFMVKHSDRPFKVKVASHVVEDLGTTFNINAYNDEGMDKTTLIEGSIKVIKSKVEKILQPGEQAIINEQDIRIQKGDIASATGWRMGKFVYRFAPVSNVLSDLERWYNITVVNKEANKNHLKATIDRNVPLSQMIRILEGTGQIHLKWDGNKLTALP